MASNWEGSQTPTANVKNVKNHCDKRAKPWDLCKEIENICKLFKTECCQQLITISQNPDSNLPNSSGADDESDAYWADLSVSDWLSITLFYGKLILSVTHDLLSFY